MNPELSYVSTETNINMKVLLSTQNICLNIDDSFEYQQNVFKLKDKKMFISLCSTFLFIWTFATHVEKLQKSGLLFLSAEMFKKPLWQNRVDPDQTAPIEAVCSGSTLFASIL